MRTEEEIDSLISSLGLEFLGAALQEESGHGLSQDTDGPVWLTALLPRVEMVELLGKCGHSHLIGGQIQKFLGDSQTEGSFHSHGFQHLRTLKLLQAPLRSKYYPADLEIGVFKLPKLRTRIFDNIGWDRDGWRSASEGSSYVRELDIRSHPGRFLSRDYDDEWGIFDGLTHLRLSIGSSFNNYQEPPKLITRLHSQAHSLEQLWLNSNEIYGARDYTLHQSYTDCPGQPSPKRFVKLGSLALTDAFLIGMTRAGPVHRHQSFGATLAHLAGMFPPTLEIFTHLVWHDMSCFDSFVSTAGQELHSWKYIWMTAIRDIFQA